MTAVEVATLDELVEGEALGIEIPGSEIEVALVRIGEEVFAITDECSHGKVRLSEGDVEVEQCRIECHLHGSRFDLRTGQALNLPATEPVPVYPTVIDGERILVDIDNPINNQEN
ncbi:hypothetical protein HMPREF1531_02424 [Propionibacterium sp. oral taxon 192 str. F0372]|uniref:non-heme iron oxygenase ferredoxin subunit n=1 Tax=Propionibacterium sp. oral taxon 192 TaxID=671222 RepID=UPI0003535C71|nr:non-heme iron oxygenase ferredoxin subunit [Propionibacterium sp. oral taxon 192]EPH00316.1 hypothetical protein HMPREF1531_02424 [Propionibacterium sp. oral taxon 192 str. F0372]